MRPKMPENLLLAIDVGNSRVKFGVFERVTTSTTRSALPQIVAMISVAAAETIDWATVLTGLAAWSPSMATAVIAGANPAGVERLLSTWPAALPATPGVVRQASELPLRVNTEHPDKVGIDRLLDAVAANVLRRSDDAAVIVDAGTATTVDLVSADGSFEGGAILPGLELGARALHQYTALLPMIDVPALLERPVAPIGKNTREAIGSGLWFGQIGAIRELIALFSERAGRPPLVLATGGNGRSLAPALESNARFEPDLALRGLAHIAQSP
jgi:type III pantothenate kinase